MQTIKTAEQAAEFIKKHGVVPQPGRAYKLYTCGCVLQGRSYYRSIFKKTEYQENKKFCPVHKLKGEFIGSFKKCGCGKMYFSKTVTLRNGDTCPACRNTRRKDRTKKRVIINNIPVKSKFWNKDLRDPDRIDCKFRQKCLDKYLNRYQALPCKNCRHYWPREIEEEISKQGGFGINKYEGI